jgi:hypothetical protein
MYLPDSNIMAMTILGKNQFFILTFDNIEKAQKNCLVTLKNWNQNLRRTVKLGTIWERIWALMCESLPWGTWTENTKKKVEAGIACFSYQVALDFWFL